MLSVVYVPSFTAVADFQSDSFIFCGSPAMPCHSFEFFASALSAIGLIDEITEPTNPLPHVSSTNFICVLQVFFSLTFATSL